MTFLVINIFFYLLVLIFAWKHNKWSIDETILIPIVWLICAVFSLLSYLSPLCYQGYYHELSFIPFAWLWGIFVVFYSYFIKFKSNQIPIKYPISALTRVLAVIFAFSSILPFLENIYVLLFNGVNWSFVLSAKDMGEEISATSHMSWISAKFMTINYYGFFILPYLFFTLISTKSNKIIVCGLLVAMLNILMVNMLNGSRNIIIQYLLYIIYNYFFIRKSIDSNVRNAIRKVALVFGSFIFLYILFITLNRFTDAERSAMGSPADWLFLYIGEEFQNFNADGWWIGYRTNGAASFGTLMDVLGVSYREAQFPYRDYMFYTAFNDLYADFGPYISILFASFFVLLVKKYSRYLLRVKDYSSYVILHNMFAFYLICGMWYNPYVNLWYQFFGALLIFSIYRISNKRCNK